MLQTLSDMVKQGELGRLEIVNLEVMPGLAREWNVRSVPWLRVGPFEITGLRTRDAILALIERAASETGMADHFHDLLRDGELNQVLETVRDRPERLADLLPIVANPDASINVRVGAGACFEEFAGQSALRNLVEPLAALSTHSDARVRADACHYLGLTGSEEAGEALRRRLDDSDAEVREIAWESLAELNFQAP